MGVPKSYLFIITIFLDPATIKRKNSLISSSYYGNFNSMIIDLYRQMGWELVDSIQEVLGLSLKSFKKQKAQIDQSAAEGGSIDAVGKRPFSFTGYMQLASLALRGTVVYIWLYVLFCWNLIARSDKVSG